MDARYGLYGLCNDCPPDGIDTLSGLKCTPGAYFCSCFQYNESAGVPYIQECEDTTRVGREDVSKFFGRRLDQLCTWDVYLTWPWACWAAAVVRKTGDSIWYSTFAASENSAWRVVKVEKVVTKACSDASVYGAVEAQDTVKCFDACGAPRNTSSPCWIGCFYRTILGAEGMLPTGAAYPGGMPYESLKAAWEAPFASNDPSRGGCPAVAVNATASRLWRPGRSAVARRP